MGAHLTFIIKKLQPEIVLKEIFEGRTASASALEMAASFEASRILFENKFRQYTKALSTTPPVNRPMAVTMLLGQDTMLLSAYMDVLNCAQNITDSTGKGHTLLYQPWLVPEGRRLATIFRAPTTSDDKPLVASLIEFEIARFGLVRIEFLHKAKQTGYRLKLQHPDKGKALKKYLDARPHTALIGDIQCLGIDKLRQREHGGILAELMFTK